MKWYQKINPFFLLDKVVNLELELKAVKATNNLEIDNLISKLNAQPHLQEMVDEQIIELKQLRADKEKLEKELSQANKRNEMLFKFIFEYGQNDSILVNKSLWGQRIEMIEVGE